MAYDEGIAQRVRELLDELAIAYDEKKMFGGLAFMVRGNMSVGIVNSQLMCRVGADAYADALAQPHVREMDFTGKPLQGFVYISERGIEDDQQLKQWIDRSLEYVSSLPVK